MMSEINYIKKSLQKKIKKGFRGYPVITIALYGPTNKLATKIAVGLISHQSADPVMMRWYAETDIRKHTQILKEVFDYISKQNDILSIAMTEKIIGCPHEEGIDYEAGKPCPQCPYWENQNRWKK